MLTDDINAKIFMYCDVCITYMYMCSCMCFHYAKPR